MATTHYQIKLSEKGLLIARIVDIEGRGQPPSIDQKSLETSVMAIHNRVKAGTLYLGTDAYARACDWYDSCNSFDVPAAAMKKGDRSVRDESYTSNNTPKSWDIVTRIRYAPTSKITRPLTDAFAALELPAELLAEVKKMMKKSKGEAWVLPRIGSRMGRFGWREPYIKGYSVHASQSDMWEAEYAD